jgi:hypothetical protein
MSQHIIPLESLTIDSGTQVPNSANPHWTASEHFRDADSLTVYIPDVMTNAPKIEVAADEAALTWKDWLDGTGSVPTLAAGQSYTIDQVNFAAMRLRTTVNVGADRTIELTKAIWA